VYSIAHIPGYVKSREQLMSEANMFVDEGTITSHIKRIRKKFMAVDPAFDCIETIYGMGYRWNTD
jgi:two-component system OmpR family response regulator